MRVWANFYVSNLRYHYKHKKIFIAFLLSGEFQENRILGSTDICLGTKYCPLVQFGTESPTRVTLKDFQQNYQIARSKKQVF